MCFYCFNIRFVFQQIVTKKNVMEYDNDNIFITEIDSMESKNDGSTNSDGCSCTKTVSF